MACSDRLMVGTPVTGGRRPFVVVALFLAACGERFPTGGADGGVDDADAGFEPAAPEPPAAPSLTPCPPGWREVPDAEISGLVTCDPFPEDGPEDCASHEAHFPGGPGCERVGAPCPAGDFAEDIPGDATVLYVMAGAPAGGTGSRDDPFATIAAAIEAAPPDAVVSISKGTFDEAVELTRTVTLWGACVEETVLSPSRPNETGAVVAVLDGAAVLRRLTLTGPRVGIWDMSPGEPLVIDSLVVRDVRVAGAYVEGGGVVSAHDLVIRDVAAGTGGSFGWGIAILEGAQLDLSRAVVQRTSEGGISVDGKGTLFAATDLAVSDTRGLPDGTFGTGLQVIYGASANVERGIILRSVGDGILAAEPGSTLNATGLVVRETAARPSDGTLGYGLEVLAGAQADLRQTTCDRNRSTGIRAHGGSLVAEDLVVRETLSSKGEAELGLGLDVLEDGTAEITRGAFVRNRTIGVRAMDGGLVLATDVSVEATLANEVSGGAGFGLSANRGGSMQVTRGAVGWNRSTGVLVSGEGSRVDGEDLSIHDTQSDDVERRFGYGIAIQGGGGVQVLRMAVQGNLGYGVVAFDPGTAALLEDLLVAETREQACVVDTCPTEGRGTGIAAMGSAAIEATRFRTSEGALCGIQMAAGGTVDLHLGEVSRNRIGANVQTVGFDLARLQDRVLYLDNEVELDSSLLPVPEPIEGIEQ